MSEPYAVTGIHSIGLGSVKTYQGLTAVLLSLTLAGCIIGILVPAGIGWDFANFYDTGHRVAVGDIRNLYNPESSIAGEHPQGNMGFWGAPISAWLYAPLSYFPPATALVIFKIQNTLALLAALVLIYFHSRKFIGPSPLEQWRFATIFVLLCLVYQPFWTIYRVGGQTTPTVFLLMTLALLSYTRARFIPAALFVILAILIKPAFVFVLIFLLAVSGVRFLGGTTALLAVLGLGSLLLMGWQVHLDFLRLMQKGTSIISPWYFNSSLYVLFTNLRVDRPFPITRTLDLTLTALQMSTKLLVLGTFIYLMIKSRKQQWVASARRHFSFLMAISFCLLISQTVFEHYLASLFLLLIYVVANYQYFSNRALLMVGAIFALSLVQNLIVVNFLRYNFVFNSGPELIAIALLKSGPLLLTLIFLWTHHQQLFKSYANRNWLTLQQPNEA